MKNLTYIVYLMMALCFVACDDDEEKIPSVKPTSTGTMTDNDGNEYQWVRIGNLDWMAENMIGGKPFYEYTYWYLGYYEYSTVQFSMDEERDEYWNTFGNVIKTSEGPLSGWIPTEKAAGKIISPAITAIPESNNAI